MWFEQFAQKNLTLKEEEASLIYKMIILSNVFSLLHFRPPEIITIKYFKKKKNDNIIASSYKGSRAKKIGDLYAKTVWVQSSSSNPKRVVKKKCELNIKERELFGENKDQCSLHKISATQWNNI